MIEVRHATTEELLALRDGEGAAWTQLHVAECAVCAEERDRLEQVRARLRALPVFAPPRDRWAEISLRARRERRQRRLSGAAGLLAAAGLAGLLLMAVPGTRPDPAIEEARLEDARTRSSAMEQVLKQLAPERRALSGEAASVVVDLQSRLESVDALLGDPAGWAGNRAREMELWNERAGLLSALVDVHATRTTYAGL